MEKVMCECGDFIYECNYKRHIKGRKHMNFINDPLQVRIIIPKKDRKITCECGSKYVFKSEVYKLAHEGSYLHWKNLNILNKGYKLDI